MTEVASADLRAVDELRAALVASGYRPVPVRSRDKRPVGIAWQAKARQGDPAPASAAALNTGVLADGLRVVDIDIDDADVASEAAAAARAMLGWAPERSRADSPRVTLVYRAAEGEPAKRVATGAAGKVEVLGRGQQFVAFGTHPGGAELCWSPEPLHAVARDDLTAISEEQVADFLAAVAPMIGADATPERPAERASPASALPAAPGQRAPDLDEIEELLAHIPADCGYDDWIAVLSGVHDASGGSPAGLALADAWSAKGGKYKGRGDVERHWSSFRVGGGNTARTIAAMARANGADLAAIARRHADLPDLREATADDYAASARVLASWQRQLAGTQAPNAQTPRGVLTDIGIDSPYEPTPELVRDTLPQTGVAFIGGQSGALKSFFALHAATCIMTGEPLAGRPIERVGGIVYVAAEGEGTIVGRMKARRSLLPDPSIRLPIRLLTGIGPILKPRDYDALEARLREAADAFEDEGAFPLVAFVIDTVTAAGMIAEDKENDPGAWQAVIDGLKGISQRLNALALPIHHAGKSASAGLRGSSNIRGGADAILMLSCDRDEVTGESRNHFLALSKSRTGVEGPIGEIRHSPVVIGRRQDGSEVTSLVLEIDPGTQLRNRTMAAKPTRATKAFSDALRDAFASESEQVRVHGKHDAPVVAAVRLGHIRDAFARYYATTGDTERRKKDALRKQFKAAFEQALSTRLIYSGAWTETEWVWRAEGNLAGTFTVED